MDEEKCGVFCIGGGGEEGTIGSLTAAGFSDEFLG